MMRARTTVMRATRFTVGSFCSVEIDVMHRSYEQSAAASFPAATRGTSRS
jgi:hypothetical protein